MKLRVLTQRGGWAGKALGAITLLLVGGGLAWRLWGASPPQGLPRDLIEKQKQLVELALPPSTDRLDWVSSHIEVLNATGTQITTLRGLPASLRKLNVSYTSIGSLTHVPAKLEYLDIRGTLIDHLIGLPPKLKSLMASGSGIVRLGSLPASLTELHLKDTSIRDLSGLPPGLKTLHLEGENFTELEDLPPLLTSLTLRATKIKTLPNLPDSLQRIKLIANSDLKLDTKDLPPLLTSLEIDDPSYLQGSLPSYLISLFPPQVAGPPSTIPASVRILALPNTDRVPFELLPPDLVLLNLTGYTKKEIDKLDGLAALRTLKLAYSKVSKLPALPPGLEELNLNRTPIVDLTGLQKKTRNLKALVFCESPLRSLDGKRELPSSLERLNLCLSRLLRELSSVPQNLKALNVSGCRQLTKLPRLDEALTDLDISNSGIKSLPELPYGLQTLTLHEGQVNELNGLPTSVRAIRIVERTR